MNATFYTFAKKENSTKRPASGSGTQYGIYLKDATGILSPQIEIHYSGAGDPSAFNYAYIGDFERYYFVREWTYNKGIWTAQLEVDALASWKDFIGASTLYVTRAAAAWNNRVVDNLFPMIEPCKMIGQMYQSPWTGNDLVVGAIGCANTLGAQARGAVNYYALDDVQTAFLCFYLMHLPEVGTGASYIQQLETFLGNALSESVKAQLDPIKYLTYAHRYPFNITQSYEMTSEIDIGKFALTGFAQGTVRRLTDIAVQVLGPISVPVPQHPQAATRGQYLNTAPYSQYILDFPPFGRFDMDGAKMIGATGLECTVFVDLVTSAAVLEVRAVFGDGTSTYMGTFNGSVGADLQLAQITTDYLGAAVSGLKDGLGSPLMAVPYVGAVLAGIHAAGTTLSNINWELSTTGANGTYLPYFLHDPMLQMYYYEVADDDVDHHGKPVMQDKVIGSLSGYVQCLDGDIELPSTQQERETIAGYLTGGFFYE